jgi:hypothetical protein
VRLYFCGAKVSRVWDKAHRGCTCTEECGPEDGCPCPSCYDLNESLGRKVEPEAPCRPRPLPPHAALLQAVRRAVAPYIPARLQQQQPWVGFLVLVVVAVAVAAVAAGALHYLRGPSPALALQRQPQPVEPPVLPQVPPESWRGQQKPSVFLEERGFLTLSPAIKEVHARGREFGSSPAGGKSE